MLAQKIRISLLSALLLTTNYLISAERTVIADERTKTCEFRSTVRKVASDHAIWTRELMVDLVSAPEQSGVTMKRLLKTNSELIYIFKEYYGDSFANRLALHLRDHVLIMESFIKAVISRNPDEIDTLSQKWLNNADEIAVALNKANPVFFQFADLQKFLQDHMQLISKEVQAQLSPDRQEKVDAFDRSHNHSLEFADHLANGIMNQFPFRFEDE